MNKNFFDVCYKVVSNYLRFPDVADTFKSINDGCEYLNHYPTTELEFLLKKDDMINYIVQVRADNVFDALHDKENAFFVNIPSVFQKTLQEDTPPELREQLEIEIRKLLFKGVFQIIKNLFPSENDAELITEIFKQNTETLAKYNLCCAEDITEN